MSVRRLHAVQPDAGFAFNSENLAWAKQTIAKYPAGKQASAVIPLLWRAQEQNDNWVSKPVIEYIGEMLSMSYIRVLEVATFYTMFQLSPVGRKAHIQVCGTTPCMLRGAEDLRKVCQNKIHHEPHHLSADGDFSWEEVECLGACVNAPMVQIFKDTYEDLTPASLEKLIDDVAAGRKVKPGPQIDRHFAAPEGALTSLTDAGLYKGNRSFTRVEPPPPVAEVAPIAAATPTPKPPEPPKPLAEMKPVSIVNPNALEPIKLAEQKPQPARAEAPKPAPDLPKPLAEVTPVKIVNPKAPEPIRLAEQKVQPARQSAPDGKPELLKKPKGGKPDDLKLIWGVGPKLENMLNSMGIWHFDQIASWTAKEMVWVDERLEGFKGRAKRDEWVKQAKKLSSGWRPENAVGDKPAKKK